MIEYPQAMQNYFYYRFLRQESVFSVVVAMVVVAVVLVAALEIGHHTARTHCWHSRHWEKYVPSSENPPAEIKPSCRQTEENEIQ